MLVGFLVFTADVSYRGGLGIRAVYWHLCRTLLASRNEADYNLLLLVPGARLLPSSLDGSIVKGMSYSGMESITARLKAAPPVQPSDSLSVLPPYTNVVLCCSTFSRKARCDKVKSTRS